MSTSRKNNKAHPSSKVLLSDSALASCEKLTWHDVDVGKLLGRGGFSQVQAVSVVSSTLNPRLKIRDTASYAIKRILPHFSNEKDLKTSMIFLQLEARVLSKLSHENIISLHAVGGGDKGMFMLLERLNSTLDTEIERWKEAEGGVWIRISPSVKGRRERLEFVIQPIVSALIYLHAKRLVFRDLKPANVGFTADKTVKLFDFGMAEQIKDENSGSAGLQGMAGTMRYMSPECYQGKKYGMPADVYSFGLLLWETLTLENPFEDFLAYQLEAQKTNGVRPHLSSRRCGSIGIQQLMSKCWDQDPAFRPSFREIRREIESAIRTDEDDSVVTSATSFASWTAVGSQTSWCDVLG